MNDQPIIKGFCGLQFVIVENGCVSERLRFVRARVGQTYSSRGGDGNTAGHNGPV